MADTWFGQLLPDGSVKASLDVDYTPTGAAPAAPALDTLTVVKWLAGAYVVSRIVEPFLRVVK